MNSVALVAMPPGVSTVMNPDVAPDGRSVVIWVGETRVKTAPWPLKRTAVAAPTQPLHPKFIPSMNTCWRGCPLAGENPVITGAGGTCGRQDDAYTWPRSSVKDIVTRVTCAQNTEGALMVTSGVTVAV